MLELLKAVSDLLSGRRPEELAVLVAYVIAPGFVVVTAAGGVFAPGLVLDFGKPVIVSRLITEVNSVGQVTEKSGVALTVEPTQADYRIPLKGASTIWTSLTHDEVLANADRLSVGDSGTNGTTPLIGVSSPFTVVVQGEPGAEILVPGGRERIEDWQIQSRRSTSLVSSVLLSCVFAFGMSLAIGLPSVRGDEGGSRKVRAKPNKHKVV